MVVVEKSSLLSQATSGTFTSSYQSQMSIETSAALTQSNNSGKLREMLSSGSK